MARQLPPTSREVAERIAKRLYFADEHSLPAITELLLLVDNQRVPLDVRRAADKAVDLFDPWEDFVPEPAAVRAFRWCVLAHDLEERKKALAILRAHLTRWGQAA